MTASSTAAVEADKSQNEAECLQAASGQKYCSAHNKKIKKTFSCADDPCEGSDTTSMWRASSPNLQNKFFFLVRSLRGVSTCRQFWFYVESFCSQRFSLTQIIALSQFHSTYKKSVTCVCSLCTSNQRVSPSYTSRQWCDPCTLLRIPTGILRMTRLHQTVTYFTKRSQVIFGVLRRLWSWSTTF